LLLAAAERVFRDGRVESAVERVDKVAAGLGRRRLDLLERGDAVRLAIGDVLETGRASGCVREDPSQQGTTRTPE
jgi:hypothetical protein